MIHDSDSFVILVSAFLNWSKMVVVNKLLLWLFVAGACSYLSPDCCSFRFNQRRSSKGFGRRLPSTKHLWMISLRIGKATPVFSGILYCMFIAANGEANGYSL